MPTYGYQCTRCDHQFDVFQRMSDAPITRCPECDGQVKRLLYPVGIVFKGSGWYITDSRNSAQNGKSTGAGTDGSANGASGDTPASKEDTAAATTS
ncbi:MAG: FmdB family zinc ribbon protein [Chloroherpetonaceae bacterium]|nr:FmdB family zinc ribbon protein [Chloroherpetonaceae bacterium]